MAAIGVVSALRVAPLTSSSNARSSPARCRAGVAPSIATNPRPAASFGGVRGKTALASPVVGEWATRMRAPKAPTAVAKAAASAGECRSKRLMPSCSSPSAALTVIISGPGRSGALSGVRGDGREPRAGAGLRARCAGGAEGPFVFATGALEILSFELARKVFGSG